MDLLGDQWTLLVLREAFNGVRRFDRFQAELGIARNTLTEMGADFFPVLAAMIRWGDQWLADPVGPPTLLHHHDCDTATTAAVSCAKCGGEMSADRVTMEPGPGRAL